MTRPVRVVLVSPLPPPLGGIARWTAMIRQRAERSDQADLSVVDIALRGRSVHEVSVRKRVLAGLRQLAHAAGALSWRLLSERPDVVHVNTSGHLGVLRDLALLLVATVFRVPFVYHLRFGRVPRAAAGNSREWRLMSWVMRRAGAVVVLDKLTETAITQRLAAARVVRIPNCVDVAGLPAPGSTRRDTRTVLFAGWVVPAKGIEDLLDAWGRLDVGGRLGGSGWRLVVAGSTDGAYLESLRDRFGVPNSVEFLGELPHPRILCLMAQCDLFVLPSHTEGFPNAVVEAMALGRAIVSTDVGAVAEMLADGCGVVVPPGSPGELAGALATLMSSEAQRAELGRRAGAKAVAEYSLESVFDRYVELWCQLGARPRSRDLLGSVEDGLGQRGRRAVRDSPAGGAGPGRLAERTERPVGPVLSDRLPG